MIGGPLLFTAPHSAKLKRGHPDVYGESVRTHLREKYTACLSMKLACMLADKKKSAPGSYCVWSSSHKFNDTDLDPNYLLAGGVAESPFHRMLHAWALGNQGKPLMHIDIHGKMDRKDTYELDLGVQPFYKHFSPHGEQDFIDAFVGSLTEGFDRALAPLEKYKSFKASCQNDPVLHGLWGGDLRTMTEQACELGIPSFQLEIPLTMRRALFSDDRLLSALLDAILLTYENVVTPWWAARTTPMRVSDKLSHSLTLLVEPLPDVKKRLGRYCEWEKKQVKEKVI
jgi:hypothetical protein